MGLPPSGLAVEDTPCEMCVRGGPGLSDEEILERLLALNLKRAASGELNRITSP